MRIVIARPEPEASALAQQLSQANHECFIWPALVFSPASEDQSQSDFVTQSKQGDLVIVTSQQVLRFAGQEVVERLRQHACLAIGRSTAQALERSGVSQVAYPKTPGSEGLLQLPSVCHATASTAWVLRAQAGRELLVTSLINQGFAVHPVCCYKRQFQPERHQQLQQYLSKPVDLVIATSVTVLQSVVRATAQQSPTLLQSVPVTVIGEKMLDYAKQVGCQPRPIPQVDNEYLAHWVEHDYHEYKQSR